MQWRPTPLHWGRISTSLRESSALQHGSWEVFVPDPMRKGLANSTSSHWNTDASELISSCLSKFSKEKLILTRLNSSSSHPEPVYDGTPTDSSTKERCLLGPDSEILEQTSSTSSLGTHSFSLQKNGWTVIGSKSSLQHLCNFCPHSLTIFSILLPQTIYVFHYP